MRFRLPATAFVALSLLSSIAHAEAPFSFDTTPGKLPKNVVPQSYVLHLVPDLKTLRFSGDETIRIRVRSATSEIVLNALNLEIASASLSGGALPAQVLKARLDPEEQTLHFALGKPLAPGSYSLSIRYSGLINSQGQGLFYDKYPTAQGDKLLLVTQMEPTDARRMLPCWDEPVFRASFQLSVDLPETFAAYSNTPILKSEPLPGGQRRSLFGPTPKMASYLVVLAAGELERIADMQDGTEVGVITTEGKQATAKYPLAITKELLHYYNDYFGIRFPLPKLDQIAAPGFEEAMENWGGIVYNDNTVLYDPLTSSDATKQDVYLTVAHEMAHQWFGDLVTTAWWDNLWLNEGFASWMSTKATDHFNPDWDFWLAANTDREQAMALDARRTTHPIQQPVKNESEANDAFDDITYLKGQSFLRMLETWLGEDAFRKGIRTYMQTHRYSSTTTADLWTALEKASGKPVAKLASDWTSEPGFPVVKVDANCENGQRRISLAQEQFKLDDDKPGTQRWTIPVALGSVGGPSSYTLLRAHSQTLTRPGCEGALIVDPEAVGYYRVEYSPALFKALQVDFANLPASAQLKLLSDTWALMSVGRQPLSAYLDLASKLGKESRAAVWEQLIDRLDVLDSLAVGEAIRPALHQYAIGLLAPKFATLGWDARAGEPFLDTQLRGKLLLALGKNGDESVITEARRRFARFLDDRSSLPAAIADPVISIVGLHADAETWEALLTLVKQAKATEERDRYFRALASAEDPALAVRTLPLSLSLATPARFANEMLGIVAREHGAQAWDWIQANGDALIANTAEFSRNTYFPKILALASDPALADDLETYVAQHLQPDAGTEAHRGADAIRLRAKLKAAVLPQFAEILKADEN